MSSTPLKTTVQEVARYKGNWGHWSWVFHRLSGLAVLSFLVIHVWDTANATFWPEAYAYSVEIFKWFPFSVGETGLMAAVLFHAFNGIRVTLLDFKPEWWRYQQQSAIVVWVIFAVTFLPIAYFMLQRTIGHCVTKAAAGGSCFAFPLPPGW
jgi:succinate dehydrogenase / fumarate reductase, cytochrome b subunit